MAEKSEPVTEGTAAEKQDEMDETEIDETLEETFPASDPPSWTLGTDHRVEPQVKKSDDENGDAE